ncbi:hypothetical protein HDA32_005910 [Spinactinospora alkalitolerans]|uniref:Uncharacterized protein n=1 Tax=Spinactinospora alkalitolerans TaxID=687207 RepID=A0A852UA02_9ACTN|nr:hypothetical protein [Spinactinospora alkalitolerans]
MPHLGRARTRTTRAYRPGGRRSPPNRETGGAGRARRPTTGPRIPRGTTATDGTSGTCRGRLRC